MDEVRYLAGISYLRLNDLARAKLHLRQLVSRGTHTRSTVLGDAHIALAEVYFLSGSFAEAAELLQVYTKEYPHGPSRAQAYLRLGQIAQKKGRREEAQRLFAKLKSDYPLSFEATLIPATEGGGAFFSVQVGVFRRLGNAQKLKRKLERKGHSPYIIETRRSRSTDYSVRVGSFATETEANRLAITLRKQGFETKVHH
jgi:tetratricopeptide (TPR) repeat protein